MSVFEIRDGLFLWIYFMTCLNIVLPDCSTGPMGLGGGLAYRNGDQDQNFGCTNDCPIMAPEIHVIAQHRPRSSGEVFITMFNSCEDPVDVILVLISKEGINWKLEYREYYEDREHIISSKVNLKQILVYQAQSSQTRSSVEGFNFEEKGGFSFDMPQSRRDPSGQMALKDWATTNYKVTSINFGALPLEWELKTHYDCCHQKKTSIQPPIQTRRPPTKIPMSTDSTLLTSLTKPATPQSDSQGSTGIDDPQTIAIVVVVVILTVILISLIIIGTLWYYHRQKKQTEPNDHQGQETVNQGLSSLARGASVRVEPNVYAISPTVDHSESQGIIREQTMPQPSAPPLPSRANRHRVW